MKKIFEQIIVSDDLVFDVGCNVGDKSNIFLSLGAKVIGFEPQYIPYNVALNRFKDNNRFFIENIALGDKIGTEIIYIADVDTISSMSVNFIKEVKKSRFFNSKWNDGEKVNINTIDNIIKIYGIPKFIKIDVEGYELNVLNGLTNSIDCISIEFNPEMLNNTIECIEYIDKLNNYNTIFNYGYREDEYFKFEKWISKNEILSYLKSINDFKYEFGDVYLKKNN